MSHALAMRTQRGTYQATKQAKIAKVLPTTQVIKKRRRLDSAYWVTLRKINMMSAKVSGQAT